MRPAVRHMPIDIPVWCRGKLFRLSVLHPTGREASTQIMQATMETVRVPYVGEREPVIELEWVE